MEGRTDPTMTKWEDTPVPAPTKMNVGLIATDEDPFASAPVTSAPKTTSNQGSKMVSTINMNKVVKGRIIGKGSFGDVWKASWLGTDVAIKIIRLNGSADQQQVLANEIDIMRQFRHPNLVTLTGVCFTEHDVSLVMEFLPGGSLNNMLQSPTIKYDWETARNMALDIAKGMNFLHGQEPAIIHRDLKSLNILVDEQGRAKVADFGLGRAVDDATMTAQRGSVGWMAPEVIKASRYGLKADVYSFGIVLWEISSHRYPCEGKSQFEVMLGVTTQDLRPSFAATTPIPWKTLAERCWAGTDTDRPDFGTIIEELKRMTLPKSTV